MSNISRRIRQISDEEEAKIQQGIAQDPDNPEWTEEDFKKAKPFREALPELAASIDRARRGRPPADQIKTPVTIRLDPDIVAHYKATGKGWQTRVNDALRKAAGI